MGVDYSPILYIGKQFEDQKEARDFYERFFELSDEDKAYIEQESFSEFCYSLDNGLTGDVLNCYNGYGFVLGINLGRYVGEPNKFAEATQNAISKWKEIFGKEKYKVIHTVRVW